MFIILLIFLFLLSVIYVKNKNGDYWKKQNIVHVKGTIYDFILGNRSLAEVYKKIYDEHPTEPHVGIFLGSKPALLLRDVENVQAVLASDFQSFYKRGIVISPDDKLADNILFIDDFNRWKILRQKLSPTFTSLKLKNMFHLMERSARDFVNLVSHNSAMVENPFIALYTYTTASITTCIFGIDTHDKNTMDSPFFDMAWKSLQPSFFGNIMFFIGNTFPIFFKLLNVKPFSKYEAFFIGFVKKVLQSRRHDTEIKRNDFIDICIELQKQGAMRDPTTGYELEPTDELMAAQAFFFFIAGADTSANTMHFSLLELSNNPGILKRVHEEIDKVFKSCDEKLTYNDVETLQYLDMVINEAMRKYPPIGLMQRQCTRNTILPVGKVKIEKDDLVVIPVFGIHRDNKYYPNPDVFDPERFAPENVSKIPKSAYLAFGEGNRICLGMRFARLQVKAGLAWLLRKYTLQAQCFTPDRFEPSTFSLRVPDAHYKLLPRNA